ncbi:MAG: DNA gyrase/topoisomerase IV subunit A, partial [Mangrovimonas sp.]|nr:DNA gyrase/topoisomerase IV subunit A [Mangrovimonas sp.]
VGSIKKLKWDIDFAEILIKGRDSKGNLVTKYSVKRIELKEKGLSTLKPRKIWFDDAVQRLNVDGRGELIGEFRGEDRILIVKQSGVVKTIIPELTAHFDDDMVILEKWIPKKPISAIYYDGEKERYFVKRFLIENENKEEIFITEHPNSNLEIVSTEWKPVAEIEFTKERNKERKPNMVVNLEEFITIKGIKALGNQLTTEKVNAVNLLEPIPYNPPEDLPAQEIEVVDEETVEEPEEPEVDENPSPDSNVEPDEDGQTSLF